MDGSHVRGNGRVGYSVLLLGGVMTIGCNDNVARVLLRAGRHRLGIQKHTLSLLHSTSCSQEEHDAPQKKVAPEDQKHVVGSALLGRVEGDGRGGWGDFTACK